jgi:hypothetical protein
VRIVDMNSSNAWAEVAGSILISSVLPTAAIQRSSSSIGTLASAVAKPQGEVVNPEKSLVVTTRGGGPRG